MEFEALPALYAGVLGGLLMTASQLGMAVAGYSPRLDINLMWGTIAGVSGSPRIAGFAIHLVLSAVIGLIYAAGFDLVGADNHLWAWGLLGATIHWIVAGLFLAAIPLVHPQIPEQRPAPGAFALNLGAPDVPAFALGHAVYGLTMAVTYAYLHSGGGASIAW